jgi:hypothetical protein
MRKKAKHMIQRLLFLVACTVTFVDAGILTIINDTKIELKIELIAYDVHNLTQRWILVERIPFIDGQERHTLTFKDNKDDASIPYLIKCFNVVAITCPDHGNCRYLKIKNVVRLSEQHKVYRVRNTIIHDERGAGLEIYIVPESFFHSWLTRFYPRFLIPTPGAPGHRGS